MPRASALSRLDEGVFLTDGGLETDLIFHHGFEMPEFASFPLLDDPASLAVLREYYVDYLRIGSEHGFGLVLDTPTWRASANWGQRLGYDAGQLRDVNRRAVELLQGLRDSVEDTHIVVSGCVGPQGDAYTDLGSMGAEQAEEYHSDQVEALTEAGVDVVSALTLTNVPEAVGVVRAAARHGVPVVIAFTVETDGELPSGVSLAEAVAEVDEATDHGATHFLVNCAHPDHFADVLAGEADSLRRIRGVRANASRRSHAELDESPDLDDGDPTELGHQLAALHDQLPHITILGGCCGTDRRHIEQIARALSSSG